MQTCFVKLWKYSYSQGESMHHHASWPLRDLVWWIFFSRCFSLWNVHSLTLVCELVNKPDFELTNASIVVAYVLNFYRKYFFLLVDRLFLAILHKNKKNKVPKHEQNRPFFCSCCPKHEQNLTKTNFLKFKK